MARIILIIAMFLLAILSPAEAFTGTDFRNVYKQYASASASRSCLTGETRAILAGLEARFGPVKVISTCRPGAVIAGSGRPSQHRYGKAVDFHPNGRRAAILAWLRSTVNGAVITYSTGHIHFDTGGYRWRGHK